VCTSLLATIAVGTGSIRVKVRFAAIVPAEVGLTTRGVRGVFADLMANFMALAPVRKANRAMAVNER
jgi:hypothetical protein